MTTLAKRETFNPETLLASDSEGAAQSTEKSVGYKELNLLSKLLLSSSIDANKSPNDNKNLVLLDLFAHEDSDYSSQ
jgi:hypothetical protein